MFNFKHLKESKQNYFTHLIMCIVYAFLLFKAFILILIHGLFPWIFQESAQKAVSKIKEKSDEHRARIRHSKRH